MRSDGEELLRAVMVTRANDPLVCAAFADYLCERIPPDGEWCEVETTFRVRRGSVMLSRANLTRGASAEFVHLKLIHHRNGNTEDRRQVVLLRLDDRLAEKIAFYLTVFRS